MRCVYGHSGASCTWNDNFLCKDENPLGVKVRLARRKYGSLPCVEPFSPAMMGMESRASCLLGKHWPCPSTPVSLQGQLGVLLGRQGQSVSWLVLSLFVKVGIAHKPRHHLPQGGWFPTQAEVATSSLQRLTHGSVTCTMSETAVVSTSVQFLSQGKG